MKAKTVNESVSFQRGLDPKEVLGFRLYVEPGEIKFTSGHSSDAGYGFGNDNPKITAKMGKITRGKAFMRGDWWGNEQKKIQEEIYDMVADFLNLPETRDKISLIIEKYYRK